ncbi:MAG: hypothetical protein R2787_16930 [Saprospiraceae bacterium]
MTPQGAKNEALQVLKAVLLTEEPVTIRNVPAIRDVMALIDLLRGLGVTVEESGGSPNGPLRPGISMCPTCRERSLRYQGGSDQMDPSC